MLGDEIALTLNSPITDEQFDAFTDVDMENTPRIVFHTKNGKEVEYIKLVRCKDCKWFCEFCDKYKQESRKDGMCEHPKFGRYTLDTTFDWFCADWKRRIE